MAWSRIDDSLHSHPKIMQVGNAATGLFVRLISYSGQHLTDGFVPITVARAYGSPRLLSLLCDAGLLHKVESDSSHTSETHPRVSGPGYVIHDYLEYNPSRQQALTDRAAKTARQQRWRERQRAAEQEAQNTDVDASTAPSRDASRDASVDPAPSRPVPDPTPTTSGAGERAGTGGSARAPQTPSRPDGREAIPDDFALSDAMRRWATATLPGLDPDYETQQFISHHRADGGRRKSWPDEWQKWMRRSARYASDRAQQLPVQGAFLMPLPGGMKPSTTDMRVAQGLAVAAQLRAEAEEAGTA